MQQEEQQRNPHDNAHDDAVFCAVAYVCIARRGGDVRVHAEEGMGGRLLIMAVGGEFTTKSI